MPRRLARVTLGLCPWLRPSEKCFLSAWPLRALRLGGEFRQKRAHRRDAEYAGEAQSLFPTAPGSGSAPWRTPSGIGESSERTAYPTFDGRVSGSFLITTKGNSAL